MKIKQLTEEWVKSVQRGRLVGDVFTFPLKGEEEKELSKASTLRFIADSKKKKVYIFSADNLTHIDVDKSLGINQYEKTTNPDYPVIYGEAEMYPNGDVVMFNSYSVSEAILLGAKEFIIKAANTDWDFFTKYIKGFDSFYLKMKKRAEKYGAKK